MDSDTYNPGHWKNCWAFAGLAGALGFFWSHHMDARRPYSEFPGIFSLGIAGLFVADSPKV
jgi:hypothetical protein